MRMKGSLRKFPSGPALTSPGEQLQALLPQARGMSDDHVEMANSNLTLQAPRDVVDEQDRLHYR